ncbi:MAG: hypothetical protein M3270_01280 [Thermoproteota archaeon]|nr:hypothetical protein [Thermoproteota archaeon]
MITGEDADNNFRKGGRYLYADYTPLEQNIDFLSQLKDFSTLSDTIFKAHKDFEHLRSVLANAESLESEVISKIDQLTVTLGDIFGNFGSLYNEPLRERYSIPTEADPFVIASSTLRSNIIHSREVFLKQSDSYRRYIYSRIEGSLNSALEPLNELTSKSYEKLPYTMTANLQKGLKIFVDETYGDNKHYNILQTNTLPPSSSNLFENDTSISYSLTVRSIEIEFWNQRRKVSDFGLKDIMIPIGLKTPITKKLKRSLDFLPGLDKEGKSQRAPKFVNVEDYHLYSANTDGKENLLVMLVDNPSKPDDNSIEIKFKISELSRESRTDISNASGPSLKPKVHSLEYDKLPRIDFISNEQGKIQDILAIKDIAQVTDISQILLLGRAILDKMELILYHEQSQLALYSKLSSIRVNDKDAVVIDASKSSISFGNNNIVAYDPALVTTFLEIIAKYYSPIIRKLKETSPMKNELILRFENADGSRKEYSLGIEELNVLLNKTDGGKKIAKALEIDNNDDDDSNTDTDVDTTTPNGSIASSSDTTTTTTTTTSTQTRGT